MTFLDATGPPTFLPIPTSILILGWIGIIVFIGITGYVVMRYGQVTFEPTSDNLVKTGRTIILLAIATLISTVAAVFIIRSPGTSVTIDSGTQFLTPLLSQYMLIIAPTAAVLAYSLISKAISARMPRILWFIPPLAFFVAVVTQPDWLLRHVTAWVAGMLNVDPSLPFAYSHPFAPPFFIGDYVLLAVAVLFAAYVWAAVNLGLERAQRLIDHRSQRARHQQNEPHNTKAADQPARTTEREPDDK